MATVLTPDDLNSNVEAPLESATQVLLQKACKRLRLSSNGAKPILASRLRNCNIRSRDDVVEKAKEFDESGPIPPSESTTGTPVRTRQPPWTQNELARLIHVLADPRRFTSFQKLHVKPENRSEIEIGRNDPWSAEFKDAFLDESYRPERPIPTDGVTQETIDSYNPAEKPHNRSADSLRSKWGVLRARFTIAAKGYNSSGQGVHDCFPEHAKGEPIMWYMFCVFDGLPSFDMILREVGDGNRAESGVGGSDVSERTSGAGTPRGTKRPGITDEGLKEVARSLAQPVEIKLTVNDAGGLDEERPRQRARTLDCDNVSALMALERQVLQDISNADENHDSDFAFILRGRLAKIRTQLDALFDAQ